MQSITRRNLLRYVSALYVSKATANSATRTHSFWVLHLLNPTVLVVSASGNARLHCTDQQGRTTILEGGESLQLSAKSADSVRVTGPDDSRAAYFLEIPGVIRRSYIGACEIYPSDATLLAIARMDTEVAGGSIVGAELPTGAARFHALAAQAVAARSVLLGSKTSRHEVADFCDTTHCQFLRSPAAAASSVEAAVAQTTGIVLEQDGKIMPARYSAACGGNTQCGVDNNCEYVAVKCRICRQLGLPRRGHGWGLCQEGAMGLARMGWSWKEILAQYYPNASLRDEFPAGPTKACRN